MPQTSPFPKRKGNYKPGPGRPPGRKNDATLALEEAARQAAASIDEGFVGDAHAFLHAVYRNPEVPLEIRIMAAGRALRVEKPALSASRGQLDINVNLASRLETARQRVLLDRSGRMEFDNPASIVALEEARVRGLPPPA